MLLAVRLFVPRQTSLEKLIAFLGMDTSIDGRAMQQLVDSTTVDALAAEEQQQTASWLKRATHREGPSEQKVRSGAAAAFLTEFEESIRVQMNRTMVELLPPELLRMYRVTATDARRA